MRGPRRPRGVVDRPEVSFFVVANGERYISLLAAQDHKRIFDNDQGPNTGGMWCVLAQSADE